MRLVTVAGDLSGFKLGRASSQSLNGRLSKLSRVVLALKMIHISSLASLSRGGFW
jgi:hypothetical protein